MLTLPVTLCWFVDNLFLLFFVVSCLLLFGFVSSSPVCRQLGASIFCPQSWELSPRSGGRVSALPFLDTAPSLGDLFSRICLQAGGDGFLLFFNVLNAPWGGGNVMSTGAREWAERELDCAKKYNRGTNPSFFGTRVPVFPWDTVEEVLARLNVSVNEEAQEDQFIYDMRVKTRYGG